MIGSLYRFDYNIEGARYVSSYRHIRHSTLGMLMEVVHGAKRIDDVLKILLVGTGEIVEGPAWTERGFLYWTRLTKRQLRDLQHDLPTEPC